MFYVYLPVFASIFCLFLLASFYYNLIKDSSYAKLNKHRDKKAGLSDLLTYASSPDDGVIVCKNGALMAAWSYSGADIESVNDSHRDAVAMRVNKALANMGSGWVAHIDVIRASAPNYSPVEASHFNTDIPRLIDDERRQFFEALGSLYESKFVITLTFMPPSVAENKFVDLMFDDVNDGEPSNDSKKTLRVLNNFKREAANFESKISSAINVKRLKTYSVIDEDGDTVVYDDFLSHIHQSITGIKKPVILPDVPIYLDHLLGNKDFYPGTIPIVGDKYIQVIAVDGFPKKAGAGALNILSELVSEYRWNTRFIFMDRHEAISVLERFRSKWKQKQKGLIAQLFNIQNSIVDEHAVKMTNEGGNAIADVNEGDTGQGYYTSNIILYNEDRELVVEEARKVAKIIDNLGFSGRVEVLNTTDAFFGSLPGHSVENVRRPIISTMNLATLLPLNSVYTGEDKAPCPMYQPDAPALMHCVTGGNSQFRLNLHIRDLGHTFIFGPTGAGKSTHTSILAMQFLRYQNAQIFVFDKGMSMFPACMGSDGTHYVIGEDKLAFAPLSNLNGAHNKSWALEWVDSLLALNGLNTTAQQRNEIARAITNMDSNGDKTLSDFVIEVQDNDIKDALKQYTIDGLMGFLLDAEKDSFSTASFTCFEIEHLMNMGDKFALPVLLYLFHKIEASLDGRPTAIFIAEAWLMLGHPVFKEKIREWLKTLRKKNCIVILDTQNISDAARSGILDVIVESAATKIFLPNPSALDADTSALYGRMGLNNKQIEIIFGGSPKRDYYYVSEKGSRLYNLALGQIALSFVGKTDLESIDEMKSLIKKHGENWKIHWLKACGVIIEEGV